MAFGGELESFAMNEWLGVNRQQMSQIAPR